MKNWQKATRLKRHISAADKAVLKFNITSTSRYFQKCENPCFAYLQNRDFLFHNFFAIYQKNRFTQEYCVTFLISYGKKSQNMIKYSMYNLRKGDELWILAIICTIY